MKSKDRPAGLGAICSTMAHPPQRIAICFRYLYDNCRSNSTAFVGVSSLRTMLNQQTESPIKLALDDYTKTSHETVMRPEVELHPRPHTSGILLKQPSENCWCHYGVLGRAHGHFPAHKTD